MNLKARSKIFFKKVDKKYCMLRGEIKMVFKLMSLEIYVYSLFYSSWHIKLVIILNRKILMMS